MSTTFDDLIISAEAEQTQAIRRREKALATVKYIHGKAKQEARARLTDDEDAEVAAAMETHAKAEQDVAGAQHKIAQLKAAKAAEERHDQAMLERREDPATVPARKAAYDQVARVGREERTYHKGNCRKGAEFLRDVVAAQINRDMDAEMRLSRHMQEEKVERGQYLERAVGTGGFAGLVVPQYLTEMYAPAVAARRPFADAMTKLPLPPKGMTVNISRITTPTGVGNQASENTPVTNTPEIDDTLLTIPVQTAAGSQTLSRQAVDRGLGVEDVTMSDMQRRYATNLDSTIVNQSPGGLSNVSQLITVDDATPSGERLYPKILQGASQSEAALLGQATPDVVVMHSRRWYWFQSQMVAKWPLIGQPGIPAQNGGVNYAERYGSGFRGLLPNGMAVITDNNISTTVGATTQDEMFVVPTEESYLWEDPDAPQFIRADQAKQLSIDLVLYGYYAYTMGRYANSHQRLSGTALVTPVFG